MPFKINRIPRGLLNLLSMPGGTTPQQMQDAVMPSLDLLQFYGMTQYARIDVANAAAAEGTVLEHVVPQSELWILFAMHMVVAKTSTMTALRVSLGWGEAGFPMVVWNEECGPFGATENGTITSSFMLPYPKLLLPGWNARGRLDILGTDATANITFSAGVGKVS